jgi:hypothetical protein
MLKHCADWHARPVASIRYQEIDHLLESVRDGDKDKRRAPRPYLANRLFSHLRDFFGWCVKKRKISTSPMSGMEKPWDGAKPRERDWFKKEAGANAIKALWQTADKIGGTEGKYLKVMILTAKRRTALAEMRWEHIEPDWFWDAPKSKSKNKRLHGVPLPRLAQHVLHPRQPRGKVFGEINFNGLLANIRQLSGIPDFIYHGIRHLAETKTAELRDKQHRPLILPHIRDMLFDHASKRGTGGSYDHSDYRLELTAAVEVWAAHVEALVQPEGAALLR